jgi:hypothetical protein
MDTSNVTCKAGQTWFLLWFCFQQKCFVWLEIKQFFGASKNKYDLAVLYVCSHAWQLGKQRVPLPHLDFDFNLIKCVCV